MSIRLISLRNKTAMFLAVLMLFSLISIPVASAAEPEPVVSWDYTVAPATPDVPATGGALSGGAVLSNFKSAIPTYSTGSLSINGWDNGADTKYWQLSLSTTGYENLTLAARTRSSGTGPRDFKVTYSLDNGTTWADVPDSSYSITSTTLSYFMPTLSLPAETANAGSLLIRFIMTSNISSRAGTSTYPADDPVQSGGTSNINNIVVTGTLIETAKVAEVTADPAGGAVAAGSKVSLACATEGAAIMYSVNGGDYQEYDPEAQVTLGTLPVTISAYGVKGGMTNGDVSAWEFTEAAAEPETVAAWDITAAPSDPGVPATSGTSSSAVLSNFRGITPSYSSGSLSINGWNDGANSSYWQLSLSTAGYKDLTLAAKTRSSGTGPRDFKVTYSTDNGATWTDVPDSGYAITTTTLSYFMPTLSLPPGAENRSGLLIRFIMTSNISSRAGTSTYPVDEAVQSGGTSNINNVVVTGTPSGSAAAVANVTAVPAGGAAAEGSKVALSCGTAGATIMYSVNGGAFQAYEPAAQVTLDTLPATLRAYGVKDGMLDGDTSSWDFTKAQTEAVTASPGSGAVRLNTEVALSCGTMGAQIKYSLDSGETWNDYSSAITLSALPASIQAYAVSAGMTDSGIATFDYTERSGNYSVYFGQLHSHTTNSDGIGSLGDAYSYAKNTAGVDFLAVTDHSNSLDNAATSSMADGSASTEWIAGHNAADYYTDGSFVGMYGFEMTWSNGTGHINTYNTPGFETRENQIFKNPDGLQQYYNILKQFPLSISQFNHPGTTFGDFNDFALYDSVIDQRITLVEVGNGEGAVGSSGYFPSYEYYTRALDKGWHLAPTNNQDNHQGKWGNANTARTVVLADSLTRDNIYDAMRNMRVYATEDEDLRIIYTLNGEIMGTILSEKPDSVEISVNLQDPDSEALGTVSVISNGGRVVASETLTASEGTVDFELSPDYSYYYIRVDEADGDIAVTAPVWIDEVEKAGIDKTTSSTALPIKGQPMTITTSLYNNESAAMNITSLEYMAGGSVIHTAPALGPVEPLGTYSYSFDYTPDAAGKLDVSVRLIATIDGVEKTFTDVLKLNVVDPAVTTKIVVDASHFNDYVSGYYSGNMTNLVAIANQEGMSVVILTAPLTDEVLSDAQLLILSAPAKKNGTAGGVPYTASPYTDGELEVIQNFAENGGNIIVTALADYQDNKTVGDTTNESAYQQNRVLSAIGAQTRINDDEVIDYDNNPNVNPPGVAGGTPYRVPMGTYNTVSPYLEDVVADQRYSFYSGCSLTMGEDATWLVKGWTSTYGFDSDNDGLGGSYVSSASTTMPEDTGIGKGNVVALATETLPGGGKLFVGGTVFYSNFEVKVQLDNYSQLQNSNYNILLNILDSIRKVVPVTPVNEVRAGDMGSVYCVEGTVTAGTTPADNAFFDTIYVQDATGGINIFPVSGADIQVGQKVRVTGTLDQYQGDLELRVEEISVTDTEVDPIDPAAVTTHDAMDGVNGGRLVKIEGTVTGMDSQNLYIDDGSGVARVFVDGYIGDGSGDPSKLGKWDENIAAGDRVSAVGLASVDTNGPRLRVRNTSEIVKISVSGHTVTFISNGSTFSSATVNYGDHVTKPEPDPAKTGYTFTGWYNGDTEWNFDSDTMPDHDLTLFAKWEAISTYLTGINLTPGAALSPSTFSKTRYYYTVKLTENTGSVTITPVPANSGATVTMTVGKSIISPGTPLSLNKGQTITLKIKVSMSGKSSHTYTLTVTRAKSTDRDLASLTATDPFGTVIPFTDRLDSGMTVTFDPNTTYYYLRLNENTPKVTITPARDDEYQKIYIDGRKRTSRTYSVSTGHYTYSKIKVVAQNGTSKTYTVKIMRDPSTDNYLKSLKTSPGKYALDKPFDKDTLEYTVKLPDSRGGITLTAAKDNKYASVKFIDGTKQYKTSSRYFSLANGTQKDIVIRVTAQANTTATPVVKDYTVHIMRAPRITGFSATPKAGSYAVLSPGGGNRMMFKWTQKGVGGVMIEVSGDGVNWQSVHTLSGYAAGTHTYSWDGSVEGSPLAPGTYRVRIKVSSSYGVSSYRTLRFKIMSPPAVTLTASPASIAQGGTKKTKITVRWNMLTNVKVEICDSTDTLVATLFDKANQSADTKYWYWYGKDSGGTAVAPGTYTVKVTAGATVQTKTVTVLPTA